MVSSRDESNLDHIVVEKLLVFVKLISLQKVYKSAFLVRFDVSLIHGYGRNARNVAK